MTSAANPRPILWVGAGASVAAGYPTLAQLEAKLRPHLPATDKTGLALVDAVIAKHGPTALENALETHLGAPAFSSRCTPQ